jgi:hypothetical protein
MREVNVRLTGFVPPAVRVAGELGPRPAEA